MNITYKQIEFLVAQVSKLICLKLCTYTKLSNEDNFRHSDASGSAPAPPPDSSASELLSSTEDADGGPFPYHVTLDPYGGVQLNWTLSPDRRKFTFHLHAQVDVDGTLALGFSERGSFENAGEIRVLYACVRNLFRHWSLLVEEKRKYRPTDAPSHLE